MTHNKAIATRLAGDANRRQSEQDEPERGDYSSLSPIYLRMSRLMLSMGA